MSTTATSSAGAAQAPKPAGRLARAGLLAVAAIIATAAAVYVGQYTPACDGASVEDLLTSAVNGSPQARARGLSVAQVGGALTLSYSFGSAARECSATLLLSDGQRLPVVYRVTGSYWDGASVAVRW